MAIETKRGYITKEEVEAYCDIAITDEAESIERLNMAEEIVDDYVGFQNKFFKDRRVGTATSGTTTTLVDTNPGSTINSITENILSYCILQIIGGTNAGESRIIKTNTTTGTITIETPFTNAIDSTSVYRISQLSKFPRSRDYEIINNIYYKFVPDQVKRACLAQMEYMIEMGDDFFVSEVDKKSSNVDGYSYAMQDEVRRMIAPKAKEYLRGFVVRRGNLIV